MIFIIVLLLSSSSVLATTTATPANTTVIVDDSDHSTSPTVGGIVWGVAVTLVIIGICLAWYGFNKEKINRWWHTKGWTLTSCNPFAMTCTQTVEADDSANLV